MNRLLVITTIALSGVAAPAAAASSDASAELSLTARVEPFCRLTADNPAALLLVNGRADIGPVRELCNGAAGYEVRADFSNLDSGTLTAGTDSVVVDRFGGASFHYSKPQHQRRLWSLSDAVLRMGGGPLLVRLSIMPL